MADASVSTLKELGRRRVYRAGRGWHGEGKKKHGRRGEDVVLKVPVGTVVTDGVEGEVVGDLDEAGKAVVGARGGQGGRGNAWFARPEYRAPRIAQRGQRGEERELRLDLKLLADVGLVGLPNAGKSTLLRAISAAKPKVAAYPFTTLEAVVGVVEVGYDRILVADIPGLIEGAFRGAGLGVDFLRHVERTKVLLHVVDGSSASPAGDVETVSSELREYAAGLTSRPKLVAVNKIDIPGVAERLAGIAEELRRDGHEVWFVSAKEGTGTRELVGRVVEMALRKVEERNLGAEPVPVVRLRPQGRRFEVRCEDGRFRVEGERVVTFAEMMPVEVEEGRQELWWRLNRWGVGGALRRAGAQPGDKVLLGGVELEWPG